MEKWRVDPTGEVQRADVEAATDSKDQKCHEGKKGIDGHARHDRTFRQRALALQSLRGLLRLFFFCPGRGWFPAINVSFTPHRRMMVGMARTTSHRLVFTRDRLLKLGDAIACGTRDDEGVRLPFGGRCMVDSIYHNVTAGQFVVTISHYPPEVKV